MGSTLGGAAADKAVGPCLRTITAFAENLAETRNAPLLTPPPAVADWGVAAARGACVAGGCVLALRARKAALTASACVLGAKIAARGIADQIEAMQPRTVGGSVGR